MLRVFLVPEGVSLSEDLSPTENVSELQRSLGQQCGVSSRDIILLTAKGHLLDGSEILGSYDGGTEEKPFFVYFRPGVTPHSSYTDSSFERNTRFEVALSKISSIPSSSALQQHLTIAKEFMQESMQLASCSKEMNLQVGFMWSGWQALLFNFSSMKRSFETHRRTFATAIENFDQSLNSYKDLLERTPGQLEILKKIVLPTFMSKSVFFGDKAHTLYDWINSQDDRSNLDDLLKECQTALEQVNQSSLKELKENATNLTTLAAELLQKETTEMTIPLEKGLETISQEQRSIAESLQLTVKRVLGSGDAAALANVSLSNCQLLKLMHGNHQKLEIALEELQNVKNSLKGRIKSGLGSLAVLQQDMTEVHTKVQFHCSQLQMTRRRFEVLEQICAAPDMMASVLGEIHWRKSFKSFFVEEGQRIFEKFEQLRQNEKNRRQAFFEKCGQHFVLSLFPSLTDRIPRLFNSVPQKFDEDVCSLPQEELEKLLQILQTPSRKSFCFSNDSSTQTDFNDNYNISAQNRTYTSEVHAQTSRSHTHTSTHTQTALRTCRDTYTQVDPLKVFDVEVQIDDGILIDENKQVEFYGVDISTQYEYNGVDIATQSEYNGVVDIATQFEFNGVDIATQSEFNGVDIATQFEFNGVDIATQSEFNIHVVDIATQFEYNAKDAGTQFEYNGVDFGIQIDFNKNCTEISTQTNSPPDQIDCSLQTTLYGINNSLKIHIEGIDTATQVCALSSEVGTQISPVHDSVPKVNPLNVLTLPHSDVLISHPFEKETNEVDLSGQVVALNAAVEGLKSQLMMEREEHRKEKEKMLKRSFQLQDSQEIPTTINVANLKVGDVAIFLPDSRANFLALTFDDRMYYLSHVSVERFCNDISGKTIIPLKRKVYLGVITEKVLVEVRKETNRLQVPVGHRLYKVTAREILLPPMKQY